MNKLTYQQAYDKVIQAYFKDEVKPYNREFCFCGTLGAKKTLGGYIPWDYDQYSQYEYHQMERALLTILRDQTVGAEKSPSIFVDTPVGKVEELRQALHNHPNFETALFNGMCAALEVLKQIHLSRGEQLSPLSIGLEKRVVR